MFIKPSRRQQETPGPRFSLHRHLARGRAWRSRLFICSSVALGVSFCAWLVGLPFTLHLIALGVGFLAGFAWPLKRSEPWALGWIDEHAGLSYRTALERPSQEDPYGFSQALSAQVERTTRRLEPPAAQPWWLPLLALALSFAVLPALNFPGGLNLGSGSGAASPNARAPEGAQRTEEGTLAPAENSEEETAAGDAQPELERTFDAPGEDPASGENGERSEGQGTESDTLERYLDSLEGQDEGRNDTQAGNTQPDGAERNPFSRGDARPGETDPQGGEGGEQRGQQGQQDQRAQQNQGEQGNAGSEAQGNSGQADQEQGNQEGEQAGQSEGRAPAETEPPQEGERQAGGSAGTPSEQEQEAQEDAPQQAQGESQGEQEGQPQEEGQASGAQSEEGNPSEGESAQGGSAGSQEGEQEGSGLEGEATDGSGSLPSEASESSEGRLDGPQSGPELLEGQRGEGVTNRAGETLAPGSDDVTIPNGRTAAEYERAAEEAINEGRIPVEYQNILRDYFR